jgi:HD-GYP domain-containing protein (c-di-GMP phosphodiesterase class II)
MKRHVPFGVEILQNTKGIPRPALDVVQRHHERYNGNGYINHLNGDQIGQYNGNGYINHLNGDQIGQFGMIGAIVDTYDAITSDRVYQHGISTLDALQKMYEWRDRDFHPTLVAEFIKCIGVFPIGSVVMLNSGEVGVVVTVNRKRQLKPKAVLVLKPDKTPYRALKTIDLAHDKTPSGKIYQIKDVVIPTEYGINPTAYLPVKRHEGRR